MKTKNIITLVVSILILAVLAFGVWWLVKNKDAVFGYVNNSNIYTQDEYDKHYQEGYDQGYQDANNNEDYYKKLLAQYESQLAEKNASLEEYQKQQEKLLAEKNDLQSQLDTANAELEAVQPTIDALEQEIAENEATMLELESEKAELEQSLSAKTQELENVNALLTQANSDIEELQAEIDRLEELDTENTATINALKSELALIKEQKTQLENEKTLLTNNLNSVKTQLEDTQALYENLQQVNSSNMTTITNLNNRIVALNTTISELTYQLQNSSSNTTALNNKIAELQASIEYYKSYIASLENGSQVVATYEYDGSVINIQLVAPGSKLSITAPEDTIYITLNGWQIDGAGEYINFNTFVITENTYFVANLTYKFDVKFMTDSSTEYDSQLIVKDNCATEPETDPVREGYVFKGWSKDGVTLVEDINSTAVTEHTTYYAVWSELHTVTYMEGSDTLTTIEVENGAYSTPPKTTDTAYKKYNGWLINGVSADPTTYKIVADTIFVADVTYSYDVIFMIGDAEHNTQIIEQNLYPTLPTEPAKEGYKFLGWSLTPNGEIVSNITTTPVTANTTYYAVFEEIIDGLLNEEGEVIYTFSELEELGYVTTSTDNEVYTLESVNKDYINGKLILPEGINVISNGAFANCSGLTGISIPTSVTSIGYSVFSNCTSLVNVELPNSITAIGNNMFYNCSSLENITIPSGITSIGNSVFLGCTNLTSISIPEGVTSLGAMALYNCKNLESITLPSTITTIGEQAFYECSKLKSINIPEGVTTLNSQTFYNCSELTSITIPSTITNISGGVFQNCYKLVEVYNLSSLTITEGSTANGYVGYYALNIHTSAEEESNLYTLDNFVMYNDNGVYYLVDYKGNDTEITLPTTSYNYSINQRAFYKNEEITQVVMTSNVTGIGNYAFSVCSSLASVTIPSGVISLGEFAFSNCSSLTSVSLPSTITSVGKYSFNKCTSLVSANLACSITEIPERMFDGCVALTDITLPSTINNIGNYAFSSCGLTALNLENVSVGEHAFAYSDITSLTLTGNVELAANAFLRTNLVTLTMSGNIVIGKNSFTENTDLTTINFAGGNISIGEMGFSGCTGLVNIEINNYVNAINNGAFYNCTNLESVVIRNVNTIGDDIFYGAKKIKNVFLDNITNIEGSVFDFLSSTTIYCSVDSRPRGWYVYWYRSCSSNNSNKYTFGVTYEEYLEIIGG